MTRHPSHNLSLAARDRCRAELRDVMIVTVAVDVGYRTRRTTGWGG